MRAPNSGGDGAGLLPLCSRPSPPLYGAATARRMARPGWRAPVPVICCGNATAGGAGKTTVALDLGQRLANRGVGVHFLLRGYGGRAEGPGRGWIRGRMTAKRWATRRCCWRPSAPAWISADRAAGARAAVGRRGAGHHHG